MRLLNIVVGSAIIATGAAARLSASLTYQVVDLGGAGASAATAINGLGIAAGWTADGRGRIRAASGGTFISLDSRGPESRAYGINNSGQTVGIRFDALGNAQAVIWNPDGSVSLLGGASAVSYATGINSSGRVVGAVDGSAAVWAAGAASAPALLSVSRSTWSTAMAVNAAGVTAGTAQLADGAFRAFTSGANGMFYGYLGTLGGASSYAQAINDLGWVAGGSTVAQGYLRAFVYFGGLMRDLGTLGAITGNSSAYGVNNAGQVVGYAQTASGESAAFLWENNRMADLNSLIAEDSGWRLLEASGINDRGQIVGRGLLGGVERAFRLDPTIANAPSTASVQTASYSLSAAVYLANPVPEPATWLMVAVGLAAVAFGSARRR